MTERSVLAADSGITANQTWIDNIAANIANANTVGYKDTEVQFQDLLSEQLQGATAPPSGGTGAGTNPVSVGSGVSIGATAVDLSEGSLEQTGVATDVAIQGSGYLVVSQNGLQEYTRDGSLTIDANGDLATQNGGLVQGWQANAAGVIDTNAPTTGVKIPTGETIPAQATTGFTLGGNLPSWSGSGTPPIETTTLNAYDSLGDAIPVTLTFTGVPATANTWTVTGTVTSPTGTTDNLWSTTNPPTVAFNPASGQISAVTIPGGGSGTSTTNSDGSISLGAGAMPAGFTFPTGDTWSFKFPIPNSADAVTQFSGQSTVAIQDQNGHSSGTLVSYEIGTDGTITGSFSNGTTLDLGQIALANFANPSGLLDDGAGGFSATPNSGQAQIGTPNSGGRGTLLGGQLEQSNVNLDTELTSLIEAQVAYDANTKPLSTEQQVLGALEQLP